MTTSRPGFSCGTIISGALLALDTSLRLFHIYYWRPFGDRDHLA
jgi:hypothetical protein